MDVLIQNILAFTTLGLAMLFLVFKFVWKPKKSNSKDCSSDNCGCH